MPGDTYTPPRSYNETIAQSGDVIDLHKGRIGLIPQHLVQAEREALDAYGPEQVVEREITPFEKAAWELSELHKARNEKMAA